jgi:hypothetical protein
MFFVQKMSERYISFLSRKTGLAAEEVRARLGGVEGQVRSILREVEEKSSQKTLTKRRLAREIQQRYSIQFV